VIKVVYAIAKTLPIRKNLKRTKYTFSGTYKINHNSSSSPIQLLTISNLLLIYACCFELLDLSKITDSETLEFISLLKSSTEGLRQTLNEYIAVLNKKCNQFPY
jgi:hypothetical protein